MSKHNTRKSLVHDLLCLLEFDSTIKLVDGILEAALVKKQFTAADDLSNGSSKCGRNTY